MGIIGRDGDGDGVQNWRHGWIPITPLAAMVKAKGRRDLADRYMKRHGIASRRSGQDRRTTGPMTTATGDGRKGTEPRGTFTYKPGTRTSDYRGDGRKPGAPDEAPRGMTDGEAFRAKRPELKAAAARGDVVAQRELERRAAKGGPPAPAPVTKAPAPVAKAPAPTPAVRKPEPRAVPDAPLAWGPGHPAFRPGQDIPGGEVPAWARNAAPAKRPSWMPEKPEAKPDVKPVTSLNAETKAANAETMFGTGSDRHLKALADWDREVSAGLPEGQTTTSQTTLSGVNHPHLIDGESKGYTRKVAGSGAAAEKPWTAVYQGEVLEDGRGGVAMFATRQEAHRAISDRHARAGAPATPAPAPAPRASADVPGEWAGEAHVRELRTEDPRISADLPDGHSVESNPSRRFGSTGHERTIRSTHRTSQRSLVGWVDGGEDGKWTALHLGRVPSRAKTGYKSEHRKLGPFATRAEAHKALADSELADEAAMTKAAERKAANAAKRAVKQNEASTKYRAKLTEAGIDGTVDGPGGEKWTLTELPDDGTLIGAMAQRKTLAVFKAGRHTVVTEHDIEPERMAELLRDTTSVLETAKAQLKDHKGAPIKVKVLVPKGDSHFSAGSGTGGYVSVGHTTIHLSPNLAKGGDLREVFLNSAHSGHFMPAGKTSPQRYTLMHELGHVIDGQNRHTRPSLMDFGPGAEKHWAAMKATGEHSRYGHDKPSEGYAEGFAQWMLAGPGSHKVSDAYAEHYGWAKPEGGAFADNQILAANKAKRLGTPRGEVGRVDAVRGSKPRGYFAGLDNDALRRALRNPSTRALARAELRRRGLSEL